MAREIDITKPLTDDDLKYLHDRSRWKDLRQYAANMGLPEPRLPDSKNVRAQTPRVGPQAVTLPSALAELRNMGSGTATTDQRAVEEDDDPLPSADPQPAKHNYQKMTVPQLKEELEARRKKYQDDDDAEGADAVAYTEEDRKDDLITILNEDDAESQS